VAAVLYGTYMIDNGNRVISSATGSQTVANTYNCNVCSDCTNCYQNCGYAYAANCGGHNLYQSENQAVLGAYNCGTYVNCNCNCVCYC